MEGQRGTDLYNKQRGRTVAAQRAHSCTQLFDARRSHRLLLLLLTIVGRQPYSTLQ